MGTLIFGELRRRLNIWKNTERYQSLQEPTQIRRENLEESKTLHQLVRDVEEELTWLDEKLVQVTSSDLGETLLQVQKLQKRHQVIEAELQSREPITSSLNTRAQQMTRTGHFATNSIEEKMSELNNKFAEVKELSGKRRAKLSDAVESQVISLFTNSS